MEFVPSRPDVIRSISQRWLLNRWNGLRKKRPLPLWGDLPVNDLQSQVDTLMFCDVVANGAPPRFLIRFIGARIAASYGGDRRGEYLDDVLPPEWRPGALTTYRQTTDDRRPVYNIVDTKDRDGRLVHLERLLLPFSRDGAVVDRILASIESVSLDGGFEQRNLAASPNIANGCSLNAVITFE